MPDFDPDKYLAEKTGGAAAATDFDPDRYLAEKTGSGATAAAEPTISGGGTRLFHIARHLAGGLGDKIIAGEQAIGEAMADPRKRSLSGIAGAYNRNLGFNDRVMEASDEAHPRERWEGNIIGFLGNAAAMAGPELLAKTGLLGEQALSRSTQAAQLLKSLPKAEALKLLARGGAKVGAVMGGVGGFGGDRSDSTLGTLLNTGVGSVLGAGAGYAAPYLSDLVGRGAQYAGDKVRDLAGWLKVNSIHPTPVLAEEMEDVPGGAAAAGRVLLQKKIGGLTKGSTAKQIDAAFNGATGNANRLAAAFDANGGGVDLGGALDTGQAAAEKLMEQPVKREAGKDLQKLVGEYAQQYGLGDEAPTTATDALSIKRGLGDEGYGFAQDFKLTKKAKSGDYGAGVRKLERAVNDALEQSLGPQFKAANTLVRQLGGARQAAERAAARTKGNTILGLLPYLAGLAGAGGGHLTGHATPEALALGLGTLLAGKYGAQVGARALYGPVGGSLGMLGRGVQALPGAFTSSASAAATSPLAQRLVDLLGLRQQPTAQETSP